MGDSISKDPYKGVRDFYPEDLAIQKYIFKTMRSVVERYGYVEYDSSILEPSEIYEAKTGEEIVGEQTYTFTDRGDRQVTLRPEMTPTLARMIARKKRQLPFPVRWYSIPNLFRYERPQRGRLREHWQLNTDVFGIEDISADIEIIGIAYDIMTSFGVKPNQFQIRINDRRLVNKILAETGLNAGQARDMQKLLDRKDKMPNEEFEKESKKIAGSTFSFNPEMNAYIEQLLGLLKERGITNAVFSPTLMRGFDYYTAMVFEVFDTHSDNNRSLFGGGRYDDLLSIFGEDKIPAVGFGMGDVTMRDVLETYELLPEYKSPTQLYICFIDEDVVPKAQKLIQSLRAHQIPTATANPRKKVGDQIKHADKLGIPFTLCIGPDELEKEKYTVKELETGKESVFNNVEEIVSFITGNGK